MYDTILNSGSYSSFSSTTFLPKPEQKRGWSTQTKHLSSSSGVLSRQTEIFPHLWSSPSPSFFNQKQLHTCTTLPPDSHLLVVHSGVLGPVDEADCASGQQGRVWVVVLRKGQEQSQHPDRTHHHTGLGGSQPLLQRVDDRHVSTNTEMRGDIRSCSSLHLLFFELWCVYFRPRCHWIFLSRGCCVCPFAMVIF